MKKIIIHYKNGEKYRYEINEKDISCNGSYYQIWTREYGYYNIPMDTIEKIEFQRTKLEDTILGLEARAKALKEMRNIKVENKP